MHHKTRLHMSLVCTIKHTHFITMMYTRQIKSANLPHWLLEPFDDIRDDVTQTTNAMLPYASQNISICALSYRITICMRADVLSAVHLSKTNISTRNECCCTDCKLSRPEAPEQPKIIMFFFTAGISSWLLKNWLE